MTKQARYEWWNAGTCTSEASSTDIFKVMDAALDAYIEKGLDAVSDSYITYEYDFFSCNVFLGVEELANYCADQAEWRRKDEERGKKIEVIMGTGVTGLDEDITLERFEGMLERSEEKRRQFAHDHPFKATVRNARRHIGWWWDENNPKFLCRKATWVKQRVSRGWSDRDAWDAFTHMSDIIVGMLEYLRKRRTGLPGKRPGDITPEEWREYYLNGAFEPVHWSEEDWWDGIVPRIITAFKTKKLLANEPGVWLQLTKEERDLLEAEYEEMGGYFIRYFDSFWD
jgi:hypothetical protein